MLCLYYVNYVDILVILLILSAILMSFLFFQHMPLLKKNNKDLGIIIITIPAVTNLVCYIQLKQYDEARERSPLTIVKTYYKNVNLKLIQKLINHMGFLKSNNNSCTKIKIFKILSNV